MIIIPDSDIRHQAGTLKNPSTFYPLTPSFLKVRRVFDPVAIPPEVLHLHRQANIQNAVSVAEVYAVLHGLTSRRKPGTWVSADTIAQAISDETGIEKAVSRRSIEFALKALEDGGWIARTWEPIQGQEQRVIWCLWQIPDNLSNVTFDLGMGVKVRSEDLEPRRPPLLFAPEGARIAHPGVAEPAQDVAPKFELPENCNVTVTKTSTISDPTEEKPAAGGATATPTPILAFTSAPAVVPAPAPPSVEEATAELAKLGRNATRWPGLAAPWVWALVDHGREDLIPNALQGDKRPPRPEAQTEQSSAAAPIAGTIGKLPPLTVPLASLHPQTLFGRLTGEAEPRRTEIVKLLAEHQCLAWDDWKSMGCFKLRLRQVAAGKLATAHWWKAYTEANKAEPGRQGARFEQVLKPHVARIKADEPRVG